MIAEPAPPGTRPGSQRSTVSSSDSVPASTRRRTTAAVNTFVTLPTRKRPVVFIARRALDRRQAGGLLPGARRGLHEQHGPLGESLAAAQALQDAVELRASSRASLSPMGAVRSAAVSALPTAKATSLGASSMRISFVTLDTRRSRPSASSATSVAARCSSRSRSRTTSSSRPTRFRDFGSDGATVWHEGGLHRVVAGREVRITAARRRRRDRAVERRGGARRSAACSASRSTSTRSASGPRATRRSARSSQALAGFRPTLNPQPFEALVVAITTQQISLHAAASIRGELRRALRRPARRRLGVPDARADRASCARGTSRRSASRARRPSTSSSSRTPISISTALAALADDEVDRGADVGPRARPLDGGLVPRAPPRAAARVARRRPRRAQGGLDVLR